jgi:hypothetical protein
MNLLAAFVLPTAPTKHAALASGDVIEMFVLPDGARLLTGSFAHDAMGANTTLAVGYAAHTNAAGTAVSAAAAAYKAAAASTSAAESLTFSPLSLWVRAPKLTPTKMACPSPSLWLARLALAPSN